MKKLSKLTALLLAFALCLSTMSAFAGAANEENNENQDYITDTDSKKMFAKLFFNYNEDVEKIISYFDSNILNENEIPNLSDINVNRMIEDLQLNTDYEETVCIIKNIFELDNYVKTEQIKDATTGINLFDNVGGLFSKQFEFGNTIQPLWKEPVHNTDTVTLAKNYFSDENAKKIGKYNAEVDIKYSSGFGAIINSPNQYIHFNQYASGSEDSRDYAASAWFVASELAWKNGQTENAYKYLGYALHPLQDKEAHGQIGRGKKTPQHVLEYIEGDNIPKADYPTGWEWTNGNRNALKEVPGSRVRYNKAVAVTKEWLSKYSSILK